MSDPSEQPWSNYPSAPQITPLVYLTKKGLFAGTLIGAMSYGALTHTPVHLCSPRLPDPPPQGLLWLFLRCMAVLLSPANSIRKGIKWASVVHTVALFSVLTIPVGVHLNDSSTIYINIREFPCNNEWPPSPIGSLGIVNTKATTLIFTAMFPLNQ